MKYLIIAACLILCGCCANSRLIETKIPIAVKPYSTVYYPQPELPIKLLKKDTTAPDVMKAYVKSVVILKGDNDRLRAILDSQN